MQMLSEKLIHISEKPNHIHPHRRPSPRSRVKPWVPNVTLVSEFGVLESTSPGILPPPKKERSGVEQGVESGFLCYAQSEKHHRRHPEPSPAPQPPIRRPNSSTSERACLVAVLSQLRLGLLVNLGTLLSIRQLSAGDLLALVVCSSLDLSSLLESAAPLVLPIFHPNDPIPV